MRRGELPLPRKLNLCVCTIEKAQAIVQHMAEAGRLSEIVAVAFDEFHLLGEGSRGATLERIIARLLLHSRRGVADSAVRASQALVARKVKVLAAMNARHIALESPALTLTRLAWLIRVLWVWDLTIWTAVCVDDQRRSDEDAFESQA